MIYFSHFFSFVTNCIDDISTKRTVLPSQKIFQYLPTSNQKAVKLLNLQITLKVLHHPDVKLPDLQTNETIM